jgi:hypothetical protein
MSKTELAGGVAGTPTAFAGEAEQAALDDELNTIAGHLNAQHARLVDATVKLLAFPDRWQGDGVWTAEQYLCWRVGLAPTRARQIVTIAERVDELPVCAAAFGRGELAIDQMAAIAKRAPWWTDQQVCGHGATMTVTQLRRTLARYPFPHIPNPDTPNDGDQADGEAVNDAAAADDGREAVDDAGPGDDTPTDAAANEPDGDDGLQGRPVEFEPDGTCGFHWDDNGRFHLHVDTDADTGAIIETALTEARDTLFHNGHPNVNWLDALRELCNRSLDTITEPARRDRYRINIHLDTTGNTSNAVDAVGRRLPEIIRRHLTCDGLLTPIFIADGLPLSVGRTQRIVPERTRRQVILRDQGCRVPGCGATRFLEVHHIIHWEDLGVTDTPNLICLCPHHHRLHHRGKLGITGNADLPDGVVFTNRAGNPIAQSGTKPKPPVAPPPEPVGTYRHPLGERLNSRWIYYNPPRQRDSMAESNEPGLLGVASDDG